MADNEKEITAEDPVETPEVAEAPVAAAPEGEPDSDSDEFDYAVFDSVVETASMIDEPPEPKAPVEGAPKETPAETPKPEVTPEATPAATPAAAAAPAATPPATPQAPEATPAAPAAEPAAPAAPTPTPGVSSEGAQDGFTALDRAIEQGREKVIDAVAVGSYQLSAEELEGIQTEPEKTVPRLLAKVHVNTVQGVLRHVAAQMPAMVSAMLQVQSKNGEREEQFFQAWPQLDKTKHRDEIIRVGSVFKQLNPNATVEDFIKHVGAQVVMMNGLQAAAPAAAPAAKPKVVPAPAFVPAGAARVTNPAPVEDNLWAEMVEVMRE